MTKKPACPYGICDSFSTEASSFWKLNESIKGFGLFYAEQQIVNSGQIITWGGSLTIGTGGVLTNTGLIQSTELSPLIIIPNMSGTPADFHNSGTIDIRTGGGAAFDCNLINDPGATIRFDGGTLAAYNIQQTRWEGEL